MQKIEYTSCFYHTVLFSCSKRSQIKFCILSNNENSQQKRVTRNYYKSFSRFDYKDFLKIYRNCTKEPYSFLTIDTTLPADNPVRFRKNVSDSPL